VDLTSPNPETRIQQERLCDKDARDLGKVTAEDKEVLAILNAELEKHDKMLGDALKKVFSTAAIHHNTVTFSRDCRRRRGRPFRFLTSSHICGIGHSFMPHKR
jgi:hypothetical protein